MAPAHREAIPTLRPTFLAPKGPPVPRHRHAPDESWTQVQGAPSLPAAPARPVSPAAHGAVTPQDAAATPERHPHAPLADMGRVRDQRLGADGSLSSGLWV